MAKDQFTELLGDGRGRAAQGASPGISDDALAACEELLRRHLVGLNATVLGTRELDGRIEAVLITPAAVAHDPVRRAVTGIATAASGRWQRARVGERDEWVLRVLVEPDAVAREPRQPSWDQEAARIASLCERFGVKRHTVWPEPEPQQRPHRR